MNEIGHASDGNNGSFYYESNGHVLAEMVYSMSADNLMIIEHTDVADSLKGQGIGKKLLAKLVEYARANNIRVVPLCPFANATFKKMKEWQDVLASVKEKHK